MKKVTSTTTSCSLARKWDPFSHVGPPPTCCTSNVTLYPPWKLQPPPPLIITTRNKYRHWMACQVLSGGGGGDPEEDEEDDLCPVECVREFKTEQELAMILEKAKEKEELVVVDFYRTSCGSCKYIEQGFAKLCKGSGDQQASVIFLKHNVIDEYDEQSEVAERLRIRTVPLFHFYKDGELLEAFPTRDKERITEAIRKYTSSTSKNT